MTIAQATRQWGVVALAAACGLALAARDAAGQAAAIGVTACGTLIPSGATGVLQADLECGDGAGVVLHHRAILDLNGHRISGGATGVDAHGTTGERAVRLGRWTVRGPGTIAAARRTAGAGGDDGICIATVGRGILVVADVTLEGCASGAIAGDRVRAERVVVRSGGGVGIAAGRLVANDVVVEDQAGAGVAADEIEARGLAVRRSGGITADTVRGSDVEVTDSDGDGLSVAGRTNLRALVATGNAGYGVRAGSFLRLDRSTVTGNDGAPGGVDVATSRRPLLVRTTCERSVKTSDESLSFGVCASDP